MSLNFIDISSWQKGLDLGAVFGKNASLDGVIVKSSGGSSYVQPTCDSWVQWLISHNRPWGFYHYLDDDYKHSSGKVEAEFWVKTCKNYFGKGVPWADYEHPAKDKGTKYLREFLDTVYSLTGVKPGVYCSLSVVQSQDFKEIASAGYPLWVAQYANNNAVYGFQENPWQKGSVSPFDRYVMHQYTSCGYLNGFSGRLDFDKFYGSAGDWKALAMGKEPEPLKPVKPVDSEIINKILDGVLGVEGERVRRLEELGYSPSEVQKKVNELYNAAQCCKRYLSGNLDYLDAIGKILKSI